MTAQTKYDSSHYNCEAMKIASMPGNGTTVGDVHDAIEKLINSEVLSAIDNVLNMLDAEIGMVDDDNAISGKRLRKNMRAHGESIKNRYKL